MWVSSRVIFKLSCSDIDCLYRPPNRFCNDLRIAASIICNIKFDDVIISRGVKLRRGRKRHGREGDFVEVFGSDGALLA